MSLTTTTPYSIRQRLPLNAIAALVAGMIAVAAVTTVLSQRGAEPGANAAEIPVMSHARFVELNTTALPAISVMSGQQPGTLPLERFLEINGVSHVGAYEIGQTEASFLHWNIDSLERMFSEGMEVTTPVGPR